MERIMKWLLDDAKPPKYPYPVNGALAARGKTVYDELCDRCHGPDGVNFAPNYKDLGKVTPIAEIGTDRHRLDSYTFPLAVNQSLLYASRDMQHRQVTSQAVAEDGQDHDAKDGDSDQPGCTRNCIIDA